MSTNQIKALITATASTLSSVLGILYIPVLLMIACNIIDYATGLMAASNRKEKISARKGLNGIIKKIAMWLLVVVGAIIDQLLKYGTETLEFTLPFDFLVACVVAVWIICNELISILENMIDIGVSIPGFLMPLVKHMKRHVEQTSETMTEISENVIGNSENVIGNSENVLKNSKNISESEEK